MSSHYIHPTAVVDEGAEIGEGTRVWHFCHVSAGAKIGPKCSLGQNVFVARGVPIGAGVKIQNNVSVYEGVEIRDEAFLGPSCVFTNVNNPRSFIERKTEYRPTIVGRGASIGANATIVCGHDVGAYAFVGAGAVVTKDVPPHALVVGNPARRIGWMSRAGLRLPEGRRPRCPQTGEEYVVDGESCRLATDDELAKEAEGPIPLLDLQAQNGPLMPEIRAAFERVAAHGGFILGKEVDAFEKQIAAYLGVPHAIGVSSGTDALLLALMALGVGPGHEVVTTPFSFFATAGCIARVGAKPVFVDIDPATQNLDVSLVERAITGATKAILPVHLFGQACAPRSLVDLAERRGIPIIEDAAQAVGARAETGTVGAIGAVGCFSFFPSKNLGCFGDGGLCTTRDPALAERMKVLRAHGGKPKYYHAEIGGNFRLDALQAAILSVKLPHADRWTAGRRRNAERYTELLSEGARAAGLSPARLTLPREVVPGHVWNQYVIRTDRRDALRAHLTKAGVGTEIYYPVPLHRQKCFEYLGYGEGSLPEAERAAREVLALPIFPELGEHRLRRVVREVLAALSA